MALSHVAALTIAYRRGEVDAADVVDALGTQVRPTNRLSLFDRIVRRRRPDPPVVEPVATSWAEVCRFWEILSPDQQRELYALKVARYGD